MKKLKLNKHKTENAWLSSGILPEYTQRVICVTLRADNIDMLEAMNCDEIIAYIEKLDDDYYSAIPTINELAQMYGDRSNDKLYRIRDLFWMWQKRYIEQYNINIYNVTDERLCNTVRS